MKPRHIGLLLLVNAAALVCAVSPAQAADYKSFSEAETAEGKPNNLIIWSGDIGWNNPSCYYRGMMGYYAARSMSVPFQAPSMPRS
jgi:hypothetical protein